MMPTYVRYRDGVEQIPPDEGETINQILESMRRLMERTQKAYGHAVRVSHAKAFGVAVGELTVAENLPENLSQGLFARSGRYPVIIRLANVPGEIATDAVNTQRGFAFKVLGVRGEMLTGHEGNSTQDFVLDTGNRFASADAKAFLMTHRLLEHAPQMPEAVKTTVSAVSRVTNKALHAVGMDSASLDFFGHDHIHPLAEAYFTQAPIRYGDYIAKLAVVPIAPEQTALSDVSLDSSKDPNALHTATVAYLRQNDAEFDVRVQLCIDLDTMPIENANKEWSEEESPYLSVARLRIPKQEAFSPARQSYVDSLSFCVSHSLSAHRPERSIMRARLRAYPEMSRLRRQANQEPLTEPTSIEQVPT